MMLTDSQYTPYSHRLDLLYLQNEKISIPVDRILGQNMAGEGVGIPLKYCPRHLGNAETLQKVYVLQFFLHSCTTIVTVLVS
jgi:hypothetical protein